MIDNSSEAVSNISNSGDAIGNFLAKCLSDPDCKIPIQLTSQTDWTQYSFSMAVALLSSIFVIFILWDSAFKPMFSAVILSYKLRQIKKKTGRPMMIIKHTNSDLFSQSMITQKTMTDITKGLEKFQGKDFDLILHTPGGEVFSSLFISRLFKQYPGKIRIIVPYYAMSGGTLLALSGHEIYMSPTACLGPVDPQLGNLFKYGSARGWKEIVKLKGKKADDQTISFSFMGEQYTKSIKEHIDSLLVDRMPDAQKREEFVQFLTSGNVEHAFPLTPQLLTKFGLTIGTIDHNLVTTLNKILSSKLYEGVYSF